MTHGGSAPSCVRHLGLRCCAKPSPARLPWRCSILPLLTRCCPFLAAAPLCGQWADHRGANGTRVRTLKFIQSLVSLSLSLFSRLTLRRSFAAVSHRAPLHPHLALLPSAAALPRPTLISLSLSLSIHTVSSRSAALLCSLSSLLRPSAQRSRRRSPARARTTLSHVQPHPSPRCSLGRPRGADRSTGRCCP